jgi:tripartite-type tricarboxylate transporter receptor subunit TctC
MMWESVNSIGPHVRSGRVRAIAIGSPQRSAGFPDIPTIAETVPGYEATTWSGVIAPAGLPRPIVDKLNAAGKRRDPQPDLQGAVRGERRRIRRRHAGGVRRADPQGLHALG